MIAQWLFKEPRNVAVISTRSVVSDGAWIALVSHDEDDGGWQFHDDTPGPAREEDAMVVSLESIVQRDATINQIADLPEGWRAWREGLAMPWQRRRDEPPR